MKTLRIKGLTRRLSRVAIFTAVAAVTLAGKCASAQIVSNGLFNTNDSSYSGYAGYADPNYGDPNFIPGFTDNGNNNGVNGSDVYHNGGNSQQFRPPGYALNTNTATNPLDYAFIQGDGYLSQNVTANLQAGYNYTLTFLSGARSGNEYATGAASVTINGVVYSATTLNFNPTTGAQLGFTAYTVNFNTGYMTPLTSAVLTLSNTTDPNAFIPGTTTTLGTDQTIDFANVVITQGSIFVPEPSSYALLFAGLAACGVFARTRSRRSA